MIRVTKIFHKNWHVTDFVEFEFRPFSTWKGSKNSSPQPPRRRKGYVVKNVATHFNYYKFSQRSSEGPSYVVQQEENGRILYDEDGEHDGAEFIPSIVKKHPPTYFYEMCNRLASEGKLAECVAVVEKRMVEDRVRPEKFNYSVVIHALGKAGQPRKAFEFFKKVLRKMTRAGFTPSPRVINSLLNACANSISTEAEYSMNQAKWLLERERELYGPPLPTTYFAAMKCFARHGDLATVFRLADDMIRDGYIIGDQVFTSLLSACLSDKESGFKLALDVWSVMTYGTKIKLSIYDYRLLLKICRECGVGEKGNILLKEMEDKRSKEIRTFLKTHSTMDLNGRYLTTESTTLRIKPGSNKDEICDHLIKSEDTESSVAGDQNVSLVAISEKLPAVTVRSLKLTMLGGPEKILAHMKNRRVCPDSSILCSLLYLIPFDDEKTEKNLLNYAKFSKIKLGVEFFNLLIKRKCVRHDGPGALALLEEISKLNLTPDIRTVGSLTGFCNTGDQCLALLRDMKSCGLSPTLFHFENFLKVAFKHKNLFYARLVISQMSKLNVRPDEKLLRFIETNLEIARKQIWQKDIQISTEVHVTNVRGYNEFLEFYKKWTQNLFVHYEIDPRLTVLQKDVKVDDLREDWEKPWAADEKRREELKEMGNIEIVP